MLLSLVAMDQVKKEYSLEDSVTVSAQGANGRVSSFLAHNEIFTLEQLMEAIIIPQLMTHVLR